MAVVREPSPAGGEIVIYDAGDRLPLMSAGEIRPPCAAWPSSTVANALAAVAITYAQGVSPPKIRAALSTFASSFEQTPGRMNVFDGHGFRVLLDYAHNPAGLTALSQVVRKMRAQHTRAIGMVSIPGDRRDQDIIEMGQIAAGMFDELVFREGPDTRGRKPGEVTGLLTEGALQGGFSVENIHLRPEEPEATQACLEAANPGDLIVLLPTEVEKVWKQVMDFDGTHTPLSVDQGATEPAE
jgi:cyanophycin synthetase